MAPDSNTQDPTSSQLPETARPASTSNIGLLGVGLIFICLLLAYLFVSLWIPDLADVNKGSITTTITWFGTNWTLDNITVDERILLLVMVMGALGSFVHTATSFSDFVGNQKLSTNWVWWYVLRPFIGMALAAIFYVAIRAGFLSGGGQPNTINLFGLTAVAGLVGMFSKQATDKLSEVFNTLFRTAPGGGDAQRKDSLDSSNPVIRTLDPAVVALGITPAFVTLRGSGFSATSVVKIGDSDRTTVFKNSGELSVTLLPADVSIEGSLDLIVFTPPPGGGRSSPISLRIATFPANDPGAPVATGKPDADGCAIQVSNPTADEALPAARGGVG